MKSLTIDELDLALASLKIVNQWLARGDGIAVYENMEIGHPQCGHRKYASYGSSEALLETDTPPETLPDVGNEINWRYQLVGVYRGDPIGIPS